MDRILDIDLDFFLNRVSDSREDEKRLNKKKYYPWEKRTLKSFLENRCGLKKNKDQNVFTYLRKNRSNYILLALLFFQ